ncbi:TetR/AcrR family transcriptional regulator [Subtercola frigoramans]|uniref:AcrR family transcriptional regulator n=1 Tax=Subtercola frigoramans TaxID=120298 RepID=A0ABS2L2E3_9MICO|nr:TetR/AcrR family transcriptional regulator [Subtercola frigoramans]MBM7471189.1 AcrR family transcriptional regulator [Subtercola frigoramans]
MSAAEPRASARAGRPRANSTDQVSSLTGREQILDAAAALFAELGFSGTSTRAIADRVGIRQQSLYYHFAGKDDILAELLSDSVHPSINFIDLIKARVPAHVSAAGALFALACVDIQTLRRARRNIGTLYLLPEVQEPRFEAFRAERTSLREAYGQLGTAAASPEIRPLLDPATIGTILMQIVEVVIQLRRNGERTIGDDDLTIATTCLRAVSLTTPEIERAQEEGRNLLQSSFADTRPSLLSRPSEN